MRSEGSHFFFVRSATMPVVEKGEKAIAFPARARGLGSLLLLLAHISDSSS